MSPLQYQKPIRLPEARRLMVSESYDAAEAGYKVGYDAASHFNREYKRHFDRARVDFTPAFTACEENPFSVCFRVRRDGRPKRRAEVRAAAIIAMRAASVFIALGLPSS